MKEVIKRIIGSNGLDVIRRMKMYIKCLDAFRIGNSERIDIHDGIELIDCISLKRSMCILVIMIFNSLIKM